MQEYWVWLALLPGLSLRQKHTLLTHMPNPEDLYRITQTDTLAMLPEEKRKALENKDLGPARKVIKQCAQKNIGFVSVADEAYPKLLKEIADPPLVLYYKGVLPDFESKPCIAVVGTRKSSPYGNRNAEVFSQQITACGGVVVSGGAEGIDTHGLQGALDADGAPIAVLGCGVDIVYPPTNRKLFSQIAQKGCLVSEYPPGFRPKPWQFPARNRIISGICDGTLVIEAPESSGALITARHALNQGRDVFVVPGNVDVLSNCGSNLLLREGAHVALDGWDVMKEYGEIYPQTVAKKEFNPKVKTTAAKPEKPEADKKVFDNSFPSTYHHFGDGAMEYTPQERMLLGCLGPEPKHIDEIIAQMDLPAQTILGMLTDFSLKGIVIYHSGRRVSLKTYR